MIAPKCCRCGEELHEKGGLIVSPPFRIPMEYVGEPVGRILSMETVDPVAKFHVCARCWRRDFLVMVTTRIEAAPDRPTLSARPLVTLSCSAQTNPVERGHHVFDAARRSSPCGVWATHTTWVGPRCEPHAEELKAFLRNPPDWYRLVSRSGPRSEAEIEEVVRRIGELPR